MEGRGSAAGHLAVVAMVLVLVMAPGALAANHVVGGTQQWNFAPANDLTYYDATWVPTQNFTVGDTLQFEYSAIHDVVQFKTLAEFTNCNGTTVNQYKTGNDSITLSAAGPYYFICGVPGHCALGMKVSVTAAASPPTGAPSPPSTTPSPPTGKSPPPPSGNAASSGPVLSMAGLLIAALVASLAFLI